MGVSPADRAALRHSLLGAAVSYRNAHWGRRISRFIFILAFLFGGPVFEVSVPQAAAGGEVVRCGDDAQLASLLSQSGTITFNCEGVGASAVILFSAIRTIQSPTSVTLDGGGKITLSGGGLRRLFYVAPGASLTLLNIILTKGKDYGGGAVLNEGTLSMSRVQLTANTASGQFGGAIKNTGSLTIADSTVANNSAPLGYGGAIDSAETTSQVVVSRTNFSGNSAALGGGAIANNGDLRIQDSTFSNNSAGSGRGGGAIENTGPLVLSSSTFTANSAGKGGAVYNEGGSATITNSTFSANSASSVPMTGGALHNQSGSSAGILRLLGSTLVNNSAPGGMGGSVFNEAGSTAQVKLSLFSGGAPANCAGVISSLGLNLDTGSSCAFHAPGDLSDTPANLGPLASNGGLTQTHALLSPSPGIDAGSCADFSSGTLAIDQRGLSRPVDGNGDGLASCDMGAYEARSVSPPPVCTAPFRCVYIPLIKR